MGSLFNKFSASPMNQGAMQQQRQPFTATPQAPNGFFGFPSPNDLMNQINNVQQAVMQTRQNPQDLVYSMLNNGQINQQQLDQALATARQMMSMLPRL